MRMKEEKKIKESNWGILGRQVLECPDCGNKKVQVEITEEGIVIKCNQCGYGITKEDVKDFEERVKKINEKEKTIERLIEKDFVFSNSSKPLPAKEEGKTKPNEEGQSTNPSDRVAGETPAREEKKMKKNIQKKPLIDPINPIATGSPEHYEYEEKGFAVISSEDPW